MRAQSHLFADGRRQCHVEGHPVAHPVRLSCQSLLHLDEPSNFQWTGYSLSLDHEKQGVVTPSSLAGFLGSAPSVPPSYRRPGLGVPSTTLALPTQQIAMVAPYAGEDRRLLFMSVAPWMIGCFLDLFTQGILLWYKDDKAWLRYAVVGLVVLTGLKCLNSWYASVAYAGCCCDG